MRSSTIGELTLGACLVLLYPWLSGCSSGTDPSPGHEPFGEIESAYVDGTEPSPAEWICDLPMTVSWQVYAPGETEFHLNECLFRNDWDLNAACHNTTRASVLLVEYPHAFGIVR